MTWLNWLLLLLIIGLSVFCHVLEKRLRTERAGRIKADERASHAEYRMREAHRVDENNVARKVLRQLSKVASKNAGLFVELKALSFYEHNLDALNRDTWPQPPELKP